MMIVWRIRWKVIRSVVCLESKSKFM